MKRLKRIAATLQQAANSVPVYTRYSSEKRRVPFDMTTVEIATGRSDRVTALSLVMQLDSIVKRIK